MAVEAGTHERPAVAPVGVNLAGYFDSMLGIGEAVRQVRAALQAAGVPVASFPLAADAPSVPGEWPERRAVAAGRGPYPVNLLCVNADGVEGAHDELGPDFFRDRRTIGLWWWEVSGFPQRWLRSFDLLDELWAGSRFVADALAPVAPIPVLRMPAPVSMPAAARVERASLGLPDGFVFLFVYDYASVVERKNPLGAVAAFERAFAPGSGAKLVLKCIGVESRPEQHGRVVAAAARHPDVHVQDQALPPDRHAALVAACDCYLSLHRSEGFGLTIAEALLQGLPAIATAYGGPLDFLDAETGYLVDHRLVRIGEGHDPYPPDAEWADPDLDQAARLMREVRDDPEAARRRARRGRDRLRREHAPEAAGSVMARRLSRLAGLAGRDGRVGTLDTQELQRRIRSEPPLPAAPARRNPLRRALRKLILRLIRPQAVHQRLVDEELVRALRTLDERLQGLAASQATLQGELRELRRHVPERERPPAGS